MEARYEVLITGDGKSALGLRYASGRNEYIPLRGDLTALRELVERCNRGALDPVQIYEVLEDYELYQEKDSLHR